MSLLRDTVINGDVLNRLTYFGISIPDTMLPVGGKGQEHELTQNFLDMRYVTARGSANIWRNTDGRIRFRVLIEPSE